MPDPGVRDAGTPDDSSVAWLGEGSAEFEAADAPLEGMIGFDEVDVPAGGLEDFAPVGSVGTDVDPG